MKKRTTELLGHDVSWNVESKSVKELDDSSEQYIIDSIKEGFTQGELHVTFGKNMNRETSGWWEVINWKDIACELYNAFNGETNPVTSEQKKAIKRFNENW